MGSLKSLSLKLALVALLAAPALAADTVDQTIGPFGTLNNYDNSYTIPADKAQDLLNVDITPGGKSVKKRAGFAQAFALTVTTSPVHGVHFFYDSNGNDVALYFNDRYMTSSVSGGSTTVLFSTGTNGATYQCIDSQGFAYCENSNRDPLIKTNGATYSQITTVNNAGTMVAVTPDRLVLAGFSASPNRLDFSKAGDFTTWTVGGNPTDPNQITITAPGSRITHITYAFDRLLWFKDTSFGYVLFGPTLADWVVRTVSPNVGTLDNSSVYRDGILYFRGQDAHIYSFDGSNLVKMTRDIQTTISASQSRVSNSFTQTTQADWAGGTFDDTTYVDTETTSGNLQTTYPDDFSTFRNGTGGTKAVWASSQTAGGTWTFSSSGGFMKMSKAASTTSQGWIWTQKPITLGSASAGTSMYFTIESVPSISAGGATSVYFMLNVSSGMNSLSSYADFAPYVWLDLVSTTTGRINLSTVQMVNVRGGAVVNTRTSASHSNTTYALPAAVTLWMNSGNYNVSVNGVSVEVGTHTFTLGSRFAAFGIGSSTATTASDYTFDDFSVSPETFTYTSPVHNAPSLTSWDAFTANSTQSGGTLTFSLRASTSSFSASAATPSYGTVTTGAVPTISTGTYFQEKTLFNKDGDSNTGQMILNDFTVNWFEGSASDKAYAVYHRDAIWWAVASGAGATSNNRILRYDLLNQGWLLYDIPMDGMYVRNQSLYFGSATSGTVYKFGDVNNDAGAAINAYWKSKDFFVDSPFTDKELGYISTVASSVSNSSMTVTYTLSGSTSTSYDFNLNKSGSTVAVNNKNIPTGKSGRTINIQFGNNAADQPFEVFGIQFGVRPKPWNASTQ